MDFLVCEGPGVVPLDPARNFMQFPGGIASVALMATPFGPKNRYPIYPICPIYLIYPTYPIYLIYPKYHIYIYIYILYMTIYLYILYIVYSLYQQLFEEFRSLHLAVKFHFCRNVVEPDLNNRS